MVVRTVKQISTVVNKLQAPFVLLNLVYVCQDRFQELLYRLISPRRKARQSVADEQFVALAAFLEVIHILIGLFSNYRKVLVRQYESGPSFPFCCAILAARVLHHGFPHDCPKFGV